MEIRQCISNNEEWTRFILENANAMTQEISERSVSPIRDSVSEQSSNDKQGARELTNSQWHQADHTAVCITRKQLFHDEKDTEFRQKSKLKQDSHLPDRGPHEKQ